ncbi:hypothetical protein [Cellulomonas sp. URHB0016]
MGSYIDGETFGKVLVAGLLFGAGIPALFALGVRALAPAEGAAPGAPRVAWRTGAAVLCFGVALGAVVFGVVRILTGGT